MLDPPNAELDSVAQTQTPAQSRNVVFDCSCRHLRVEGDFFIRLSLANETQNLNLAPREHYKCNRMIRGGSSHDSGLHSRSSLLLARQDSNQ
jgi:hypothetical protein